MDFENPPFNKFVPKTLLFEKRRNWCL